MVRESLPPKRHPPLRGQPCLALRIWTLRGLVHHFRESPEPLSLSLTSTRERTSDRYDLEVSLISRKQVYDCFPILFPPSYSPNPCHPWFPAVEEMRDNRCVCVRVCDGERGHSSCTDNRGQPSSRALPTWGIGQVCPLATCRAPWRVSACFWDGCGRLGGGADSWI